MIYYSPSQEYFSDRSLLQSVALERRPDDANLNASNEGSGRQASGRTTFVEMGADRLSSPRDRARDGR
jgi:hypothetical protein